MGEGVDKIAVGVLGQALQGHGAAGGIPDQALQLVAPMGGDLGVGVERKALDAGTAGTGERGRLALGAKACANAPDRWPARSPKAMRCCTEAAMVRASSGASSTRGVIAGGHRRVEARLQVSQPPQHAEDPMADLLDHRRNVSIGGGRVI